MRHFGARGQVKVKVKAVFTVEDTLTDAPAQGQIIKQQLAKEMGILKRKPRPSL